MIKRFISFFTAAAIAITTVFMFDVPNIVAQAVTANGDYGNGVKWSLDNSGELTISGSGNMPNWEETQRPYKSYLNNITSVKIENGVTSIGLCAFDGCTALKAVAISSSVISIGNRAFSGCTALETIILPDNVKSIGTYCFSDCTKLKNVTISSGVNCIDRNAFRNCTALETITIPSSITTIAMVAFDGCNNLKNVTLEGTTPPTVQSNSFSSEVIAFNVPCSSFNDYKTTGNWTNYANKIQTAHNYGSTWSYDGTNHWQECSICKDKKDTAAHSWDSGKVTTAATCTAKGVKTYTCTVCGQTKTEEIAATGHTEVTDPAVAATCTTTGKTAGKHCSVCNAVITAQTTVSAKGHTEVTDPAVAATCTTAGKTEGKHCSVCNTVITAQTTVSAKGHTEVTDPAVAATCTTAGKTEGKHCSVCDTVITAQTTVPALTHDFGEWTVTKAATCTAAGTKERTCNRTGCGETETETIPASGHNYAGGICTVCETIDAEHDHTGGTATCKDKAFCSICGQAYGDLAAHTLTPHAAVPAACTTTGNNAYWECSVCNKIFSDENGTAEIGSVPTIPALEHNYVDGTCTRCGNTDPSYEPPHEHNFVNGVCECGATDPNYEPPHEHTYVNGVCECGETDPNYEPPHEHDFVNGVCDCGATDPTYNPSGNVTADVQDTAGTNTGLVQGNTLIENVLTPEDKTEVENGSSFEIVLEVTDIRNSVSPADVTAASSALKSDEEIGVYVDLSLFKIKDGTEKTPIHNASGQIGITLTIPDTIFASDRTYSIIRVHDGIAENLGGTYDKTSRRLTFYTDKFSTYAIAYTASSVNIDSPTIPSTPTNPTTPSNPSAPSTPSVPAVTPTVTETAAKTEEEVISDDEPYIEDVSSGAGATADSDTIDFGDTSYLLYVIVIFAILGVGIIYFKKSKQK